MTETRKQSETLAATSHIMKRDWDDRARENARWFITTISREQTEADFDATGRDEIARWLLAEPALILQGRDPRSLRVLEIGCGIGRMTRPLAEIFGEVVATDVSGEMIGKARERLTGYDNVRLYETSGVDFRDLPDDYFDLAFSIYVFQHVPSAAVIRANITDAYRTLRPGGLLKFHTNSITVPDYEVTEKDTWRGAAFPEAEIRGLAAATGAQLISIFGAGTAYCWTTFRKRRVTSEAARARFAPHIEFHGRADDLEIRQIPVAGNDAVLTLIASGLDAEACDANNLRVEIGGQQLVPRYVGQLRPHCEAVLKDTFGDSPGHLCQIEVPVSVGLPDGPAQALIRVSDQPASLPVTVEFAAPQPLAPKIVTVRNGADFSTEIHACGAKSAVVLYVQDLNETATTGNVRLHLGARAIKPDFVGFVAEHGTWQVAAQLPPETEPGEVEMRLCFDEVFSPAVSLQIR